MKIYLISQNVNNNYDTYDSAVVIAENEEEARKIHPEGTYDYPEESKKSEYKKMDSDYGSWVRKKYVIVKYVGEAKEGSEKGVVCASFNAG